MCASENIEHSLVWQRILPNFWALQLGDLAAWLGYATFRDNLETVFLATYLGSFTLDSLHSTAPRVSDARSIEAAREPHRYEETGQQEKNLHIKFFLLEGLCTIPGDTKKLRGLPSIHLDIYIYIYIGVWLIRRLAPLHLVVLEACNVNLIKRLLSH